MRLVSVLGAECWTAAGNNRQAYFNGLIHGIDHSIVVGEDKFDRKVNPGGRVCFLADLQLPRSSYQNLMSFVLNHVLNNLFDKVEYAIRKNFSDSSITVVLASTKGIIEDYVWQNFGSQQQQQLHDPYDAILKLIKGLLANRFIKVNGLVINNACASSHVAVAVAQDLINKKVSNYVLVVGADLIGPFIYQGFESLKVLTKTKNCPFDSQRDGLQLGEAISAVLVGAQGFGHISITNSAVKSEGGSVTRPSMDGSCLRDTIKSILPATNSSAVDFVIAHGTGTRFNDSAEDQALKLSELTQVPVACTKWSIGHTLGASGLLDMIAALDVLEQQKSFVLGNTAQIDEKLSANYLTSKKDQIKKISSVLITSLGFGGAHASVSMELQ